LVPQQIKQESERLSRFSRKSLSNCARAVDVLRRKGVWEIPETDES
jgi:hypothetical protein